MFIWIILISFIIIGILDVSLRKRLNIPKNERFMDQYVGRKHFIIELWLCIMFLVLVTVRQLSGIQLYVVLFLFIALVFAIRSLAEYVFRKQEKRHYISLIYTFVSLICSIMILFFG